METIEFDWIEHGTHDVGFSAQQLQTVLPEAVSQPENSENLALMTTPIISALVKAVQELNAKVEALS